MNFVDAPIVKKIQSFAYKNSLKETDRATYQAMEALIHNLNTMNSRAGAQTPFSSINYGTDTSIEGRLVIKNILLAEEAGLGNGETPIFPIHIFKIKEGVNFDPDDPNYDLSSSPAVYQRSVFSRIFHLSTLLSIYSIIKRAILTLR